MKHLSIVLAVLLVASVALSAQEPSADFLLYDYPALADFGELTLAGRTFSNGDLEGKIVFMNFWAPWCKPCIEEMPELHRLYERFKNNPNVLVLAVHTGWAGEPIEKVRAFVSSKGYTVPVIYDDDGSLRRSFDSGGIPRNYLIDGSGQVRALVEPRPLDSFVQRASDKIENLLQE